MSENLSDQGIDPNRELSPGQKGLRFAVIFMGILIVLGVAVIIGTVIKRSVGMVEEAEKPVPRPMTDLMAKANIALPAGSRVVSETLDGSRLLLRLESEIGQQILIIDLETGKTVSTLTFKPE